MSKEYKQLCDYGKKPEYHYEGCELYAALQNKRLAEKVRNDSPSYISESYTSRWLSRIFKGGKAMAKVKVFISGPITGYENNNRARFYEAERMLRGLGFDVFNPVWMDFTDSWDHEEIMSVDLAALATCDAIYQLEGWEHSKGAPTGVAARMRDAYIAQRGVRGGIRNMVIGSPVRPLSFINLEHREILQLLVDMTFNGASDEELERAIKYSKIVIDAEKDKLAPYCDVDWRKAAVELGIPELKKKYMPFGVPIYGMKADSVTIDEVHELDPFGLNDKKETENEEN